MKKKKVNHKKRLSTKKLKSLIKEEKEASKMYKGYGFNDISKQEAGHAKKLERVLKKRK